MVVLFSATVKPLTGEANELKAAVCHRHLLRMLDRRLVTPLYRGLFCTVHVYGSALPPSHSEQGNKQVWTCLCKKF